MIRKLREMQIGQYIRDDGPQTHLDKAGTPTMGGTLIILSIAVSILLWSDLTNFFVWITLFVVRNKLVLQFLLALIAGFLVYNSPDFSTQVTIPFFKRLSPDFGWGYILFAAFVIVGASNAVNLTDGLDGLAIGPMIDCRRHLHDFCLCRRPCQNRRLSANKSGNRVW